MFGEGRARKGGGGITDEREERRDKQRGKGRGKRRQKVTVTMIIALCHFFHRVLLVIINSSCCMGNFSQQVEE